MYLVSKLRRSVPRRSDRGATHRVRRRVTGALVGVTLVAGVGVAGVQAAWADSVQVSDATLAWGLSGEQGGGSFFGGCNFLSAGAAPNAGSSRLWTEADGFYATQAGNVTVEKPDASGTYAQPTWATKCQDPNGNAVSAGSVTSLSRNRVVISHGTGTVDPDANTATISWTGSFTSVFYGGLTYWSATDPTLTVDADGTGTLTATASGYAASMSDPTQWVAIEPVTITLANLTGVVVSATGFTVTPDYRGVAVTVDSGTPQAAYNAAVNGAYWGSFPQNFVDFQLQTGQSSYWYTSGGARDAAKVATPLSVGYAVPDAPAPAPTLSVSPSAGLHDGDVITVTGSGFDTTTPNAHGPGIAGAYVELGWIQSDGWQPSAGYGSSTRSNITAVWVHNPAGTAANEAALNEDGTFQVNLTVDAAALAEKKLDGGTLAVFTIAAGGAVSAGAEAWTPISLATAEPGDTQTITVTVPQFETGEFTWTLDGSGNAVTLSDAENKGAYLQSTGALQPITVTDTRTGGPAWSISGQVSDFTGPAPLSGKLLGWTPAVLTAGAGATAGDPVASGIDAGNGLSESAVLAAATAGHAAGSGAVGADLDLRLPITTPAGTYTATLTITALS